MNRMTDSYEREDRVSYTEKTFAFTDPIGILREEKESISGQKYHMRQKGRERKWCLPEPEVDGGKSIDGTDETKKRREWPMTGRDISEGEQNNKNIFEYRTNNEPFTFSAMQVGKKDAESYSGVTVSPDNRRVCSSQSTSPLVEKCFSFHPAAQAANAKRSGNENAELPANPCYAQVAVEERSPSAALGLFDILRHDDLPASPPDALQASAPVPFPKAFGCEPATNITQENATMNCSGDIIDSGAVWQPPQLEDFDFFPSEPLAASALAKHSRKTLLKSNDTEKQIVAPFVPVPVDNECRGETSHPLSDTLQNSPNGSGERLKSTEELRELWNEVKNRLCLTEPPQARRKLSQVTPELQEVHDASLCPRTRTADILQHGENGESIPTSDPLGAERRPRSRSTHAANRTAKTRPQAAVAPDPSFSALRALKCRIAAQHSSPFVSSIPKQTQKHPSWRVPPKRSSGAPTSEQRVAGRSVTSAARAKPVLTPYTESYSYALQKEAKRKRMNSGDANISGGGGGAGSAAVRPSTVADVSRVAQHSRPSASASHSPSLSHFQSFAAASLPEPEPDPAPLTAPPPQQTPFFAAHSTFIRARRPQRAPSPSSSPSFSSPSSPLPLRPRGGGAECVATARRWSDSPVRDIGRHPPSPRASTRPPSADGAPLVWTIPPPPPQQPQPQPGRGPGPQQPRGSPRPGPEPGRGPGPQQPGPEPGPGPRRGPRPGLSGSPGPGRGPRPGQQQPRGSPGDRGRRELCPEPQRAGAVLHCPSREGSPEGESPAEALSRAVSVRSILRESRAMPPERVAAELVADGGLRPEERLLQQTLRERQAQLRLRAAKLTQEMDTWDAEEGAAASTETRGALKLMRARRRLYAREWAEVEDLCWEAFGAELLRGAMDPISIVKLAPPWQKYCE